MDMLPTTVLFEYLAEYLKDHKKCTEVEVLGI